MRLWLLSSVDWIWQHRIAGLTVGGIIAVSRPMFSFFVGRAAERVLSHMRSGHFCDRSCLSEHDILGCLAPLAGAAFKRLIKVGEIEPRYGQYVLKGWLLETLS
jgi:hypothetical protein